MSFPSSFSVHGPDVSRQDLLLSAGRGDAVGDLQGDDLKLQRLIIHNCSPFSRCAGKNICNRFPYEFA